MREIDTVSDAQWHMLWYVFDGRNGFEFSERTANSLVRRGLIERKGLLALRLTDEGSQFCQRIGMKPRIY